jgi:hypothetical protein
MDDCFFIVYVAPSNDEGFVHYISWGSQGKLKKGGPKGWRIRKDNDVIGERKHFHCEKNGDVFIIKQDGTGSHDTKQGTRLPNDLGTFLSQELELPLDRKGRGYYVRCLSADEDVQALQFLVLLTAIVNAEVIEII